MSNPERINIHDLVIEEPEKQSEVVFDPEKIWKEEDFEELQKLALGQGIEKHRRDLFLNANAALAVLDKQRLPALTDGIKEKIWDQISTPQTLDEDSLCYLHLGNLAWASQISPEFLQRSRDDKYVRMHRLLPGGEAKSELVPVLKKEPILEQVIELGRKQLEDYKSRNDWRHIFEIAAWLTVVGSRPKFDS